MERFLVLGGGLEQLPLIRRLESLGFSITVLDGDFRCPAASLGHQFFHCDISNPKLVSKCTSRLEFDAIVTIASQAALSSLARLSRERKLPAMNVQDMAVASDKALTKELLVAQGLDCGDFYVVRSGHLPEIPSESWPLVVKPADSSGNRGVQHVSTEGDLLSALEVARSFSATDTVLVEPWHPGPQFDVQLIAGSGRLEATSVIEENYLPQSGVPTFYTCPPVASVDERGLRDFAVKVARALRFNHGAAHCEVRIGADGKFKLIEFDPRMGGESWWEIVELATGYDYLFNYIAVSRGLPFLFPPKRYQRQVSLEYAYNHAQLPSLAPSDLVHRERSFVGGEFPPSRVTDATSLRLSSRVGQGGSGRRTGAASK